MAEFCKGTSARSPHIRGKTAIGRCVIKDLLGNTLVTGSLVWWLSKQLPLKVSRIDKGGLSTGRGHEVTPARITFEIEVPVQAMPNGEEPQFTDFLCTMNPDAEKIIEGMLEGQRTQ